MGRIGDGANWRWGELAIRRIGDKANWR